MAVNEWIGRAGAVAQVTTITVSGAGTSTATAGVNVGPKQVRAATASGMSAATFANALYLALVSSAEPEAADLSYQYTAGGVVITATGNTPGQPVTVTNSSGGGFTVTVATPTPATGPNDAANVVNWSLGHLPDNVDPGVVRTGPDILYNLDTGLVASTALDVYGQYTGNIGLPDRNPGGYFDYRPKRAKLAAAAVLRVGVGGGPGLSRGRFAFAGAGAKVYVMASSNPAESGEPAAVDIDSANALAELHVIGGACQYNRDSGGGSAGAVHVTGGRLVILNNAPLTSLKVDGGRCDVSANMAAVTLTMTGGETHVTGGTQSTWSLTGGTLYAEFAQATGSPVAVTAQGSGSQTAKPPTVDARPCPGSVRIATGSTFKGGAALIDPFGNTDSNGTLIFDPPSLAASQLGPTVKVDRT